MSSKLQYVPLWILNKYTSLYNNFKTEKFTVIEASKVLKKSTAQARTYIHELNKLGMSESISIKGIKGKQYRLIYNDIIIQILKLKQIDIINQRNILKNKIDDLDILLKSIMIKK